MLVSLSVFCEIKLSVCLKTTYCENLCRWEGTCPGRGRMSYLPRSIRGTMPIYFGHVETITAIMQIRESMPLYHYVSHFHSTVTQPSTFWWRTWPLTSSIASIITMSQTVNIRSYQIILCQTTPSSVYYRTSHYSGALIYIRQEIEFDNTCNRR